MSSTPIFRIFDIPELVEVITQFLNPYDIAQCSATCKELALQLEPYLWQHFYVTTAPISWNKSLGLRRSTLLRVRHYLRTIDIRWKGALFLPLLADGLPSLAPPTETPSSSRSLELQQAPLRINSITIHDLPVFPQMAMQRLLTLASNCSYLTTLNIPSSVLAQPDAYHKSLLYTIQYQLLNLEQLAILKADPVHWDRTASLFNACFRHPRLTTLKCWFTMKVPAFQGMDPYGQLLRSMGIPWDNEAEDDSNYSNISNIRALRLPVFSCPVRELLIPLLIHHGPRLEYLGISNLCYHSDHLLQDVVAQYCSKLRHLSLFTQEDRSTLNPSIVRLLCGLRNPGLLSFSLRGTIPLRNLGAYIDIVTQCHAHSLEVAETMDGHPGEGSLTRLVARCEHLKRLWVGDLRRELIIDRQWACLGLKEVCYFYDPGFGNASRRVFLELGRLVNLEVLSLGCYSLEPLKSVDTGSKCGWLSELAGLKKLRHLIMMTDIWSQMGQNEVGFMDKSWPQLEKISFGYHREDLANILRQHHWQWLKTKKPWIRLTYWNDVSSYIARNT
ncbi:hypothetical protein BGX34_003186 [Mortierella sp. NVP85]|nr:hypothetical protein BGX34_003186 [Mortierella sp. NVP85]